MADALSRYPDLANEDACAATVTLVAPQIIGILGRVRLAAQGDQEYQRLKGLVEHAASGITSDPPGATTRVT